MSTNFLILKNILAELKRKNSITVLGEYYQGKWEFYDSLMDLANDEKAYKDLIELANQAKKAVSKYFRRKDIELQAFYVGTEDANRVLNINLTNYNRSEPIRISDILQQERDISELNIYCDKKHNIYAYRKGKERHYEFKEDAYYEMTSTWPVQDKHGKTFTCTMVMNVSSSGITEVLQFNGKDFESPPKEFWKLIRQNEELYIQGLSLHDAVKALLAKNKNASAVSNLQNNEHSQDEKLKDLENDIKNSSILSLIGNNVSTQTEINPQQIATQVIHPIAIQTEVNLQHTETQTEVAVQHVETQTGIGSQQAEIQNLQEVAIQAEVNLREAAVQTEVNSQQLDQKLTKAEQETRELNEQRNHLQYRLDEAKQKNVELEKHNSDLQNELGEEKQKNVKLQIGLTQKDEKLENISTELQEKAQELESVHEEKKDLKTKLEVANAERRELINELSKLQNALVHLEEERFHLKDDLDQLRSDNESIKKSKEERISDLEKKLLSLQEENRMLSNRIIKQGKSEQEFMEAKQKIEELEKYNKEKQKNAKLQAELTQKNEKLANMSTELQGKAQELESVHEGKEDLEKKLTIANAEREKLKSKVNQLEEEANENENEVDRMRYQHDKSLTNLKSQMRSLDDEYNTNLESYKQCIDQLKYENGELKSKLELKDEQSERQREQLRQEIEEEITNEYHPLLELKFKEYDNKIEELMQIVADKVQEIERINKEKKELNDKVQYLNSQVEMLSLANDQLFINKQEALCSHSKTFYHLTEKIDDSEKKSRSSSFNSVFNSDDDDHCSSPLGPISSTSNVCINKLRQL
ncbi:hypothetical protein wVul_0067 [Wolbachia endosymbiont of Armadillidium vulgare str. wVulC]|uniref:hypothetical protein n=1 Tax=Wolbachia endosymbiont of Armadillidium vulgare TaxID=77039 RepID=UPI0006494CBC|nr:hypothetical protein [Wolbachia endosymbiont of Armadillidium vulgare]KLT22864.1 hypothetical protein wVul_0067 [Wolbachia endosymbiont of Armadillidium vulgare str. wVulC]